MQWRSPFVCSCFVASLSLANHLQHALLRVMGAYCIGHFGDTDLFGLDILFSHIKRETSTYS